MGGELGEGSDDGRPLAATTPVPPGMKPLREVAEWPLPGFASG